MKELSRKSRTISTETISKPQKTPEEVAMFIKTDLKFHRLTLTEVARQLNCYRQVISMQLLGKKYLSKISAERLANRFGYTLQFLRTGIGMPFTDPFKNQILLNEKLSDAEIAEQLQEHETDVNNLDQEHLLQQYVNLKHKYERLSTKYNDLQESYIKLSNILADIIKNNQTDNNP